MTAAASRKRAEAYGRLSETIAALYMFFKGYRVVARRYRSSQGEIDLIVRRGKTLVFVEVKARGKTGKAAEAISHRQKDRISRAAQVFLQQNTAFSRFDLRFDALLVGRHQCPVHIVDAWRPYD